MKKIIALLLALTMVACLFVGCKSNDDPTNPSQGSKPSDPSQDANKPFDYDAISDTMESPDGKYVIAFVTDVGQLKDKSFNQGTWEGIKRYASENNKTYKYYQPAGGNQATDDDRFNAMKDAVDGGAQIVVCAGFLQATALTKAAETYPDVKFVFIDGWVLQNSKKEVMTNVMAIDYQEEQSGYLAGYVAVMEGYTKLGFAGGGGGANPACCRFGYGFVQGANAAAAKKGIKIEMNYSWEYGSDFSASPELQTMLASWYQTGTEVIFACGGSMSKSAFAAAAAAEKLTIGVDVDQSGESDTVLTSATKGLRESVMSACKTFFDGKWDTVGGKQNTMGAKEDAVGLPTIGESWRAKTFTVADYNELFNQLKAGTITVDRDYEKNFLTESGTYENVTVNFVGK